MPDVKRYEEIKQFYVINSKQRRIDTDLALALLQTMAPTTQEKELVGLVGPGKKYRIRATRLTFEIASSGRGGPWSGRIKQPHDLPEPEAVLSVKSFADSLQPIVSSRSPVYGLTDSELVDTVNRYWTALADLMPEAFANPKEHSVQKTPGVFSLHIVAAKTVFRLCRQEKDFSAKRIGEFLKAANNARPDDQTRYMTSEFWVSRGEVKQYGGSGGHRSLATYIRNKIEAQFPLT